MLECIEINPDTQPSAAVIWLHGLGADGHDFEPIVPQLQIPDGLKMRFVFPHAPMRPVTINSGMVMRAWFDVLGMEPEHRIDVGSFAESVESVEGLVEKEIAAGIPPERIVLAGFSQGGAVALHTGLRFEKRLAGILALSCYLPTIDTLDSERSGANREIPIMMAHGTADPVISMSRAVATRKDLSALGYEIHWHEYPMPHAVCGDEIDAIRSWLLEILPF
jgi:phospholipase/carboxylesterase